jgi:25S rRNA (uracil2634-N3)-methyltransferase
MSVLAVGDGDFSFSLALARMTSGKGLEASSYESKKTLLEVYPGIQATMDELESLGAKLFFQVDATNIRETLPLAAKEKYDRIVWNFPCEAVRKGQDGQNKEMDRNKDLVRRFVDNARTLLVKKTGQIHINHKTKVGRRNGSTGGTLYLLCLIR